MPSSISRIYNKTTALSPRAQSWLVLSVVALSLLFLVWYVVPYVFDVDTYSNNNGNYESFNTNEETTGNNANSLEAIRTAKTAIAALPEPDQRRVCAPTVSMVSAYRSLFTGAAFKFQESREGSGEFFLYGPDMRVVEIAADGTGALGLGIRNENPSRQLFVRETAVKQMDGSDIASDGETCYVFTPKIDPNMALQYEHEHLSLRPLTRAPVPDGEKGAARPFVGQCFVRFQATEEELNKMSLATGLGVAGLSSSHLDNGSDNYGPTANNSTTTNNNSSSNNTNLAAMTREIEEQARTAAVRDYAEYRAASGTDTTEVGGRGNPFANKPIQVSLNLGTVMGADSFSADADAATSRNPESGSATSVRALLDKYTASQMGNQPTSSTSTMVSEKEMAINKAYLASMNSSGATATQPVGCPVIDRSKYYTERQLAQCAGCTPDNFLRGK